MRVSISVDPDDGADIDASIMFLESLPGYVPPKDYAEDVPPMTLPQVIDEVRAQIADRLPPPASEAEAVAALQEFVKRRGVPAAVAALAGFKVARVTELAPEQRGMFVASLKTA